MRWMVFLAMAVSLVALAPGPLPARAQSPGTAAPSGGGTAPALTAPGVAAAPAARTARPRFRRQPLAERFADANTSHDGHLTRDQANTAKWSYVVNNFDGIDKDRKGFVSVEDIRGYAAAKRAARKAAADAAAAKG